MRDYTSDNPSFSKAIKILEVGDPGHADNVNVTTKQLLQNTLANRGLILGAMASIDITVPASGWEGCTDFGEGVLYADIPCDGVTESMVPLVSLSPESLGAAKKCGMLDTARTSAGKVRLYARKPPEAELHAGVLLVAERTPEAGIGAEVWTEKGEG